MKRPGPGSGVGASTVSLVTMSDMVPHLRMQYSGFVVMALYVANLLNVCQSENNLLRDSKINSTSLNPKLSLTSQAIDQSGDIDNNNVAQHVTRKPTNGKSARQNNDVIGLQPMPSTTQENRNHTKYPTPKPYTRRDIYIRGHLLKHPPPGQRKTFHPPEAAGRGVFQAPNSVHLHRVQNFRDGTDWDGTRQKRKQRENERFHNYKLLYGNLKDNGYRGEQTEFYAWIFGASMLGVIALTTLVSGVVFCFYGNPARRAERAKRARRPSDTAGEYQRVESVSSIVDNVGDTSLDTIYEEEMDSVTII